MSFVLILFDHDGCTSVVPSKMLDSTGTVKKAVKYRIKYRGQDHLVEALEVSDSKTDLNDFELNWTECERSKALDREKRLRGDQSRFGGFLRIWPQDSLPTAQEMVQINRQPYVKLKRTHVPAGVKKIQSTASNRKRSSNNSAIPRRNLTKPRSTTTPNLKRRSCMTAPAPSAKRRRLITPKPRRTVSTATSIAPRSSNVRDQHKNTEQETPQENSENRTAVERNKTKTGSKGRSIRVLYEGSAEEGAVAEPKRTPLYTEHLSSDQQELLQSRIIEFSGNKRSIGIQTEKVLIFSSVEELKSAAGSMEASSSAFSLGEVEKKLDQILSVLDTVTNRKLDELIAPQTSALFPSSTPINISSLLENTGIQRRRKSSFGTRLRIPDSDDDISQSPVSSRVPLFNDNGTRSVSEIPAMTTTTNTDGQTTSTTADTNRSSNVECAKLTPGLDFLILSNNVPNDTSSSHLDAHQPKVVASLPEYNPSIMESVSQSTTCNTQSEFTSATSDFDPFLDLDIEPTQCTSVNVTSAPLGNVTSAPLGNVTSAPLGNVTSAPLGNVTSAPGNETSAPLGNVTSAPLGNVTSAPLGNETSAPLGNVTSAPLGNVTSAHLGNVTSAPLGNVTSAPLGNVTSAPLGNVISAPLGNVTSAPLGNVTSAPLGNVISAPLGNVTSAPLGNVTSAPLGNVTSAPLGNVTSHRQPLTTIDHQQLHGSNYVDIRSFHDMKSISYQHKIRISRDIVRDASVRATHLGNFGWILAQQVYAPDDLLVCNYNGKGRMGLSPRRKHAIEEAALDTYGSSPGYRSVLATSINTGIRSLKFRTKCKQASSKNTSQSQSQIFASNTMSNHQAPIPNVSQTIIPAGVNLNALFEKLNIPVSLHV